MDDPCPVLGLLCHRPCLAWSQCLVCWFDRLGRRDELRWGGQRPVSSSARQAINLLCFGSHVSLRNGVELGVSKWSGGGQQCLQHALVEKSVGSAFALELALYKDFEHNPQCEANTCSMKFLAALVESNGIADEVRKDCQHMVATAKLSAAAPPQDVSVTDLSCDRTWFFPCGKWMDGAKDPSSLRQVTRRRKPEPGPCLAACTYSIRI